MARREEGAAGQAVTDEQHSQAGCIAGQPPLSSLLLHWLGGRDSNPDTVVQSHVSYH